MKTKVMVKKIHFKCILLQIFIIVSSAMISAECVLPAGTVACVLCPASCIPPPVSPQHVLHPFRELVLASPGSDAIVQCVQWHLLATHKYDFSQTRAVNGNITCIIKAVIWQLYQWRQSMQCNCGMNFIAKVVILKLLRKNKPEQSSWQMRQY